MKNIPNRIEYLVSSFPGRILKVLTDLNKAIYLSSDKGKLTKKKHLSFQGN